MATAESGGAGGKFRKKPYRRTNPTPYDRPASALRPSQVVGGGGIGLREKNNSWISKLVDPASRLITSGAHKLFSSVFRKRLLPPPQPQPQPQPQPSPDETTEVRDEQPENTVMVSSPGSKEAIVSGGTDLRGVTHNGGVAELEDILKQKTFTRSEIDHLTALLKSRTVDGLVVAEKGTSEPKSSSEMVVYNRQEIPSNLPSLENRVEHATTSTPVVRSKVLDDIASPADLAKAYMGSRPMRASPSIVGLQNNMPREDRSATYNSSSKPKSSAMSLIQRPSSDIGASDNSFMTPRFRGKSAIYSMARTPYSRLNPAQVFKAAGTASDVYGASSLSHNATESQPRQALKRRSSVLESDIGFVGSSRRIRQKPNLLHHKTLSLKYGSERLTDTTHSPPSINRSSNHSSSIKALTDNGMISTSNDYVPPQSVQTAEKIFQHIDNIAQKGKSLGKKIDIVEGSSPEKRISDMRDGVAGKGKIESLKVLETSEGSRKENGLLDPKNAQDCSPKVPRVEKDDVKKFPISVEGGLQNGSPNKTPDNMIAQPIFGQKQTKQAFRISAHEEYVELDDDVVTNDAASTATTEDVNSNDFAKNSGIISDNPPQIAVNSSASPPTQNANPSTNLLATKKESSQPDGFSATPKIAGFQSSFVPSSSATNTTSAQAVGSSPLSVTEMDKADVPSEKVKEINSINSNSPKLAPLSFSSSYSSLAPVVSTGMKTELLQSEPSGITKVDEAAKTEKKNTFVFGDASKKSEDTPSAPSTAKGFLFGSPSNNAILSNGLSSSNGGSSATKTLSSTNDETPNPNPNPSPNPASSAVFSFSNGNALSTSTVDSSVVSVMSSTSTPGKTATSISAPALAQPTFQFGSSATVSATKSEAQVNENQFGKLTANPFSAKPSDISEPTGVSETPVAATPAFPGGSIFGLQTSSSAIGASVSTQPLSSQSASSAPYSIFGLDASKVANPFAPPASTPASSAPGTSTITSPISSSTTGIFNFQSSTPTLPFGTSSQSTGFGTSSQSTGFAFGSTTSGTTSAANNSSTTPSVFGASPITSNSSPFVFGSTSSSVFSTPSAVGSTPAASSTSFPSPVTFGAQPFAFGSTTPGGNNDQMSMEDSMAEDSVQVSTPAAPVFGAPVSGPSTFVFGGAPTPTQTPPMANPFQFGGQQTQIGTQNTTPFQPSGSFELNAGGAGSFSLGSGGADKSNRRIVRVKNRIRKK